MDAIEIILRAVDDGGVEVLRIDHARATFDAHAASPAELAQLTQIAATTTRSPATAYELLRWLDGAGGRIRSALPQSVVILVDEALDRRGLPLSLLSRRSNLLGSDVTQLAAVRLLQRGVPAADDSMGYEHVAIETRGGSNEGESRRRRRSPHDDYDI